MFIGKWKGDHKGQEDILTGIMKRADPLKNDRDKSNAAPLFKNQ